MENLDKEFFERVDAHIDMANSHIAAGVARGKANASMMYASTRFNAWMAASSWESSAELADAREQAIEYFLVEYRKMLEHNLDDYVRNFDTYRGQSQDVT